MNEVISSVRLEGLDSPGLSFLPTEFRLFQWGDNETSKGTFKLDAKGADAIMSAYAEHGVDLAIDYEHQTFSAENNGKPAPAAGWFKPEVRADGLYATDVRWTPRAAEMLRGKEYRYFSPTFEIDKQKRITRLLPLALTNFPASRNQQPLIAASEMVDLILCDPAVRKAVDARIVSLAQWDTAFIDNLPDSAFLYVAPGGKKDGEGKTVPRSLRHFPVRDSSGKVDPAHLRNALARIPDSDVPADVKKRATAEAERLLGNQHTTTKANDELTARIASAFRSVMGIPNRKRSQSW